MALPHVSAGALITSTAWNNMVDEFNTKVNKAGDIMTGRLSIQGGNWDTLTTEGDLKIGNSTNWLKIGVATGGGGEGHVRLFQGGTNKAMFIGTGSNAELSIVNGNVGINTASPAGTLHVNGSLRIGASDGPLFELWPGFPTHLRINNHTGNAAATPRSGGFHILSTINNNSLFTAFYALNSGDGYFGSSLYVSTVLTVGTNLRVNGTSSFGGAKTGYVADIFVNRVGDALEEGDLVIIGDYEISKYYGMNDNIPIPEIDIAEKAYDTRVCGIVAKVVTDSELPPMHNETMAASPIPNSQLPPNSPMIPSTMPDFDHPFKSMVAQEAGEGFNHRSVGPNQMGQMVTLGAFAHCKVDADIAPIKAGDLLTTSPTKGHAQKVLDPKKAVGAIIGKALGSLESGKGKIAVMVLLQ